VWRRAAARGGMPEAKEGPLPLAAEQLHLGACLLALPAFSPCTHQALHPTPLWAGNPACALPLPSLAVPHPT